MSPETLKSPKLDKQKQLISKLLAVLISAVACYILWSVWFPIFTKPFFDSPFDYIFLFIFPIPCTLVALYFLNTARHLWTPISSLSIHKLSVSISIIFAITLLGILSKTASAIFPSQKYIENRPTETVAIIIAGLFYLAAKKCLHKWFSVPKEIYPNINRFATKVYFWILAFSVWATVSQTADFLPRNPNNEHSPQSNLLGGLILFGSIPLAFWVYRLGLKLFLKKLPSTPLLTLDT